MLDMLTGKRTEADTHGSDSMGDLLGLLESGWQIHEPVYVMKSPRDVKLTILRFVLWRNDRPHVVSVADGAEVRQFVAEQSLRKEAL